MTSTIPKLSRRSWIKPLTPWPDFGSTSQIVFRASLSWAKNPEAPMSRVARPARVAVRVAEGLLALLTMVATAWAASGPMVPRNCASSRPCAASAPKNQPARPMAITSSGAIEKIE